MSKKKGSSGKKTPVSVDKLAEMAAEMQIWRMTLQPFVKVLPELTAESDRPALHWRKQLALVGALVETSRIEIWAKATSPEKDMFRSAKLGRAIENLEAARVAISTVIKELRAATSTEAT